MHLQRHGETYWSLHKAVIRPDENFDRKTFVTWCTGRRNPRSVESMKVLGRVEQRYRLPSGYFAGKLENKSRSITGFQTLGIKSSEQRRLAWHLPTNFNERPLAEQEEIVAWVRNVVLSGTTEYRKFQAAAMRNRFAIRFPSLFSYGGDGLNGREEEPASDLDVELAQGSIKAPQRLNDEMRQLVEFKTSVLAAAGQKRIGVWGDETASQRVEHIGLMLGALVAAPFGPVRGRGVPLRAISLGLLIFPSVWDWYLHWRERRRGFFTNWEVDMLRLATALARQETGWLRQNRWLAERLRPVPGLVSHEDVELARSDWDATCDQMVQHAGLRVKEVARVARIHRDPFEAILPVLEADNPLAEYRKITEEILRLMPNQERYPIAAAEAVRSFLLLRLGLHLGVRQKNLRQLMFSPRGGSPMSERQLVDRKRGELRWSDRDGGWEVVIPSIAFKNSTSSYFGNKPYRLLLPDLAGLYPMLEAYISRHRRALLRHAKDPGTFFVKTVKATSTDAEYNQNTFYEAWRLVVQRYGIYNPYTERGAIKGLLPHGPHNVRDVLATHILKKTGSFEQASYAIQDTPDMVAKHYGRFLPQDKAALAAKVLNQVWAD